MSRDRVTVVDSKNHERVLGTIPAPAFEGRYRVYSIYNPHRTLADMVASPEPLSCIRELRMEIVSVREEMTGWTHTKEYGLSTSAKLEDLMLLRDFRLPGESEDKARLRERYSRL